MKYDELFFMLPKKSEEYFLEDEILSILLLDGTLVALCAKDSNDQETVGLYVNCNDVFWWACAEVLPLPYDEIGKLYKECYDENGNKKKWGSVRWACLYSKMRPQHPIEDDMKADGYWDEKLESLPVRDNTG